MSHQSLWSDLPAKQSSRAQSTKAPCALVLQAPSQELSPWPRAPTGQYLPILHPWTTVPAWTLFIISTPQDLRALTKTPQRLTDLLTEYEC